MFCKGGYVNNLLEVEGVMAFFWLECCTFATLVLRRSLPAHAWLSAKALE